jgi:hypothetical protein
MSVAHKKNIRQNSNINIHNKQFINVAILFTYFSVLLRQAVDRLVWGGGDYSCDILCIEDFYA